jgi:hypothetical protein
MGCGTRVLWHIVDMKTRLSSLCALVLMVVACPGTSSSGEGEGEAAEGEGDSSEGEGEVSGEGEGEPGEGEGEEIGGEGEGEGEQGPPPEGSCRVTDECGLGESCASPNDPPGCGIAPPDDQCFDNSGCPAGQVCDVGFACGFFRQCIDFCNAATCQPGEQCIEGRCETLSCNDGFLCPLYLRCGPRGSPLDNDEGMHDCELVRCNIDGDCLEGNCVNGSCAATFGACELPRP